MSDYGEFCRKQRKRTQRYREAERTECPGCGHIDGKKIWLGESCDRCGTKIDKKGRVVREDKL